MHRHGAAEPLAPPGLRTVLEHRGAPLNDVAQYRITRIAQPSSSRKRYAVAEAVRDRVPVMFKAFWDEPRRPRAIRTLHETKVYEHLYRNADHPGGRGGLPNVVPWVETIRIADADPDAAPRATPAAEEFWSQLAALRRPADGTDLVILVTELAVGAVTLEEYVGSKAAERPGNMAALIVQLVHTLHLLARAGVTHNDLHAGNILVLPSGTVGSLVYWVDGEARVLPPGVPKAMVFDLDLASCPACGANNLDEPCEHRGVCDRPNPRFDVYMMARFMLEYAPLVPAERRYLERIVPHPVHEEVINRMCHPSSAGSDTLCTPFPRGQPREILTAHAAARDKLFFAPYILR